MTEITPTDPAATDAAELEFVVFAACSFGPGRLLKARAPDDAPHRIPCDCPEGGHVSFSGRARRPDEECELAVEVPDAKTPQEPTAPRRLTSIGDAELLAAVPQTATPANLIGRELSVKGNAIGTSVANRAEWLNFDAGETLIIITRQGAPKPVLLRRA